MDREIKFRAWDKDNNRMLESYIPYEQPKREYIFVEFGVGFSDYNKESLEIMQRTGLKDSKGKDIYEGDILGLYHPKVEPIDKKLLEGLGTIVCHPSLINGSEAYTEYHEVKIPLIYQMEEYIGDPSDYEVLGNLYENPDLLPKPTNG